MKGFNPALALAIHEKGIRSSLTLLAYSIHIGAAALGPVRFSPCQFGRRESRKFHLQEGDTLRNTHIQLTGLLLLVAIACPLRADEPVLLLMPEPPAGMTVTKTPLRVKDKVVGYHVQVADDEGFSKVVVQIETTGDRTEKPARMEGLKSYVNGLANGLKGAGYELLTSEVPNLKTANFDRQLKVNMEFKKEQDSQLLVRQFIYFTDKGYNIQVFAENEQELQRLSYWAQYIRPAEAVEEVAWRGQSVK